MDLPKKAVMLRLSEDLPVVVENVEVVIHRHRGEPV